MGFFRQLGLFLLKKNEDFCELFMHKMIQNMFDSLTADIIRMKVTLKCLMTYNGKNIIA